VRLSEPVRNLCPALRTTAKRPSLPRWQWSMQCCSAAVSSVLPSPRAAHGAAVASQDAAGSAAGSGARKSGYCPRSTRPPAALARAPVDDAESESRSRSRSCCGARQSFAIARTGSLPASWRLPAQELDRGVANSPCIHICPWCSPALGLGTSRNSPFGSASTPLGAPGYVRTDYTLPATQRLEFAQ
jgi:hypothetical protein